MRSVIVSGVGDGIGAAVVRELNRNGHKVVVVSRGRAGAELCIRTVCCAHPLRSDS